MNQKEVILGTRGSGLALCQARMIAEALGRSVPGLTVTLETITTRGDRDRTAPLASMGGTGVFVKEIEAALLGEEIDLAVHSLKDLPTVMPAGLTIAAVPAREDARDALISRDGFLLEDLPPGARVGTSSPRRRAQLLHLRPDLEMLDLRGNVDTRLRRLDEGRYDATVLAVAGLSRLGLADRITQRFSYDDVLPAVGQGALAIQIREADAHLAGALTSLEDAATRVAVTAERAFLKRLEGGCHLPAGAHADVHGGRVLIEGCIAALDGSRVIRDRVDGEVGQAAALGIRLAESLLAQGGETILRAIEGQ